jgi:hypothetical protein
MTTPIKQTSAWLAIYSGQTCVGHVINRGPKGFEAFDVDDRSIGVFPTLNEAASALEAKR